MAQDLGGLVEEARCVDMQGRGIVLIWILVLRALAAVPSPLWPRCAVWLSCFGEDLLECMLGRFPTSNFQIPGGSGHLTGKLLLNVKLHGFAGVRSARCSYVLSVHRGGRRATVAGMSEQVSL